MKQAKQRPFYQRQRAGCELWINRDSHHATPPTRLILRWFYATLATLGKKQAAISLSFFDEHTARQLNAKWRGKDYATNVLSFAIDNHDGLPQDAFFQNRLWGDLVICPAVVEKEAQEQQKTLMQHYAHLTCHGLLHLAGFDHIEKADADVMEALEIRILKRLGYPNPYQ